MFEYLKQKKVKFRKTGEVVFLIDYNCEADKRRKTDWVSYIDKDFNEHPRVSGLNAYWDFEEVKDYEQRERERIALTHLCLFSGMAMQSIIAKSSYEDVRQDKGIDAINELSVKIATDLCDKLDKIDVEELLKRNTDK